MSGGSSSTGMKSNRTQTYETRGHVPYYSLSVLMGIPINPTTTALTSSPNPSTLNQSVTLTATVSPATATGTVTFFHGTTAVGTSALVGGAATLGVSNLSKGAHSLTATYGGDAEDLPSTSPAVNQIVK